MLDVKQTDRLFTDSPYAGEETCICSRCGNLITEEELPIRVFVSDDAKGPNEDPQITAEYRFCEKCSGMLITPYSSEE